MTADDLAQQTLALAAINSHTDNVAGVRQVTEAVAEWIEPIADDVTWREVPGRPIVDTRGNVVTRPVGPALLVRRRPGAPRRVLLCGHSDTVFPAHVDFAPRRDGDKLRGPGVADMKGGIVVFVEALRRLEQTGADLGWTLVLVPDEEVGTPSGTPLLRELAGVHEVGFVGEPALPDGVFIGDRGGSGNFELVLRGRSAHVGRDFARGSSAMHLACEAVGVLTSFNRAEGVTVNVGSIDGGGPPNVVADLAVVRLNVRVADAEKQEAVENDLRRLVQVLGRRDGITANLHGAFFSPPKPADAGLQQLVADVGNELGVEVTWQPSGGVCDGNKLAAAGLPNIDTMGVVGAGLHSTDEWCDVASIDERAELMHRILRKLDANDPPREAAG